MLIGVHIADYTIVSANAVVTKTFDTQNVVLAGIPVKMITNKGFKNRTIV